MAELDRTEGPRIIAHRGYSATYPENTPTAFRMAVAAGAHVVETDLRLSRDGAVVCVHDAGLERLAGDTALVAETSFDELRRQSLRTRGHIHGVAEMLAAAQGRATVLFDVKIPTPVLFEKVLLAVDTLGMAGDVVFGLRHPSDVDVLRGLAPDATICALFATPGDVEAAAAGGVPVVRLWESWVTRDRVETLQASGARVWITVGGADTGRQPGDVRAEGLRALHALGIDGALVNDPDLALGVFSGEVVGQDRP